MILSPAEKMKRCYAQCLYEGELDYQSLYEILTDGSYITDNFGQTMLMPGEEVEMFLRLMYDWSSYEKFCVAILYMYMNYLGDAMVTNKSRRLTQILSWFNIVGEKE